MGYDTASRVYIEEAIANLQSAVAADDCVACKGLVSAEVAHLKYLVTLTDGVRLYVDTQAGTTQRLTEGVQRVQTALGQAAPAPEPTTAPRKAPGGPIRSLLGARPRLLDLIDLGR